MIQIPFLSEESIDAPALEQKARSSAKDAVVTFQGVVRGDRTKEGDIDHLFYEAYESMALKQMEWIVGELRKRWPNCEAAIQHRTGRVPVGKISLFIAVSAPARQEAFDACRFAIDQVKTRVPLWKKNVYTNGKSDWLLRSHETMLVSDQPSVSIPES
jgi:molybdopterin synthase catalytic subunit